MTLKELKAALNEAKTKMAEANETLAIVKAQHEAAETTANAARALHYAASEECTDLGWKIQTMTAAVKVLDWTDEEREALTGPNYREANASSWAIARRAAINGGRHHSPRWAAPFIAARAILRGEK